MNPLKGKFRSWAIAISLLFVVTVGFCVVLNYFNVGAFEHPVSLNGDGYFSVLMPGNYDKTANTLGTADAPLFRTIYSYDNKNEEERIIFRVIEDKWPAAFSDSILSADFMNKPQGELIQNYSNNGGQHETLLSVNNTQYLGYPSIDVLKRADGTSVITQERYIQVGHNFYTISLSADGQHSDYFNRFANTFKILLSNQTVKAN